MRKLDIYQEDSLIYSIFLEKDFSALPERLNSVSSKKKKALIVTDDQVAKLFLEDLKKYHTGLFFRYKRMYTSCRRRV